MHLHHSVEIISRRHEAFYTQTPGLQGSRCDSIWRPHGLVHRNLPDSKVHGANMAPPGSCRPHMGPMLAPWTLLSGLLYHFFSCQMWAIPAFSWGLRSIHQVIQIVGLCLALPTTTRPAITWWGIHTACVSCLQHQQRERKQQVADGWNSETNVLMLRSYISLLDIDTEPWTPSSLQTWLITFRISWKVALSSSWALYSK